MHGFSISDKNGRDQQWRLLRHALGPCMLIYRFLTGEDDAAFCHKVTKALSEGWQLHGSPSYAYDGFSKKMKAGQAVTRIAKDQPYDPDKKLVDF
jgi:hypothetical protein